MNDMDDIGGAAPQGEGIARRGFLQLLGGAIAVPSLAACTRQPPEEIVPFVQAPEDVIPGRPLFYATATLRDGVATGVLVEAHMGRPTKIEGNPEHPSSLGGTDAIQQAEILQLYDPDRSQTVMHNGQIASWAAFVGAMQAELISQKSKRGASTAIVTGDFTSPTLKAQLDGLLAALPEATWVVHAPVGAGTMHDGTRLAFGQALEVRYDFEKADVILSLDGDFLGTAEGDPRYIRGFATRRRAGASAAHLMNRLYVVESQLSLTGANADHRVALRSAQVEHVARVLARRFTNDDVAQGAELPAGVSAAFMDAVYRDLTKAGKRGLVVAGRFQPPAVHAAAAAINHALASEAVAYLPSARASASDRAKSLKSLVDELNAGGVELLIIAGPNPVYSAPGDLDFAAAMQKARLRVHLGAYVDETAALCHWHIPEAHTLEAWSDAVGHDGTVGIIQPLIEPLFGSKSTHELFAALGESPDAKGHDVVRAHWGRDDAWWRQTLHRGLVLVEEAPEPLPSHTPSLSGWPVATPVDASAMEIVVRPDPWIHDGAYSNNAWLQELPKPLTKSTWDNAAIVSEADAARLQVETGDVVKIALAGREVDAPAFVMPGQAEGSITVHLGYGRTRAGKCGTGGGFDAYRLSSHAAPWILAGASVTKTGRTFDIALAQIHQYMEGRDLVRSKPARAYTEDPKVFEPHPHKRLSLYPKHDYPGYSWGMSIDLASCVGCSACVTACQSENNIPVVGKAEVLVNREMHWLRIDRYFDEGRTKFQPVPCMHCENAPCEVVCPVQATAHHDEGLNDMVYNRCVGTKYCSNNCPYKVRRYNFFGYSVEAIAPLDPTTATMKMLHNPDVTVRSYGVMEKCTYCVQRINYARVEAKKEDRKIRDGDVMTACQAACPARAISFGDINDPKSEVSQRKGEARNYSLLADLNTEPRTTYLAHLSNPNKELEGDG